MLVPMVDLSYLMSSSVPEASKKGKRHHRSSRHAVMDHAADPIVGEAQPPQPDDMAKRQQADDAVSRSAGPAAKHRSAAAMAMIMALDGHQETDWDTMVKNAWWGCVFGKGLFFKLTQNINSEPIVFMSLGFVVYSVLGWQVPFVNGQVYIQMANGTGQSLQCFVGHYVQTAHEFKGLTVELLVCKPQFH